MAVKTINIVSISIADNNLQGEIPPLDSLHVLTYINLLANNLIDPIPS